MNDRSIAHQLFLALDFILYFLVEFPGDLSLELAKGIDLVHLVLFQLFNQVFVHNCEVFFGLLFIVIYSFSVVVEVGKTVLTIEVPVAIVIRMELLNQTRRRTRVGFRVALLEFLLAFPHFLLALFHQLVDVQFYVLLRTADNVQVFLDFAANLRFVQVFGLSPIGVLGVLVMGPFAL